MYKSGECYDSRGIPIHRGDLLRLPHFRGPRRKMYYNYHVAVGVTTPDGKHVGLRMIPCIHLDEGLRKNRLHSGGSFFLTPNMAEKMTIVDGPSLGDCLLFDERPKRQIDYRECECGQLVRGTPDQPCDACGSLAHRGWLSIAYIAELKRRASEFEKLRADIPTLHRRRCWDCKNEAWHADNRTPYVLCRNCGSQDTRIIKEAAREENQC